MKRLRLELVADSTNGHEGSGLRRFGLDLGAQSFDMDVERLGVTDVVGAPDAVDQLTAREHPSRVAQEQLEQLELLERERDLLPVDRNDVSFDIHAHWTGLDHA